MSTTVSRQAESPRVWILSGSRVGDNGQLQALAEQLPGPIGRFDVSCNALRCCPNRALGASCRTVRSVSPPPQAPWPEIVIGVGQRSVPLARWIRAQSGGRTKLVQLGRPRAPLDWFDLVVTTPQYGLPRRANVLENALPVHGISPARLARAGAAWRGRFAHLSRPFTAIFLGGPTWGHRVDVAFARRLAQRANAFARASGGSLLISTAPRTPPAVADAFAAGIDVSAFQYLWHREAGDRANPFLGYLALADRFWVTEESVSLLSETCATGKPVSVVPLPRRASAALGEVFADPRVLRRYVSLVEHGIVTPPRRIRSVHERLVQLGCARWRDGILEVRLPPDASCDPLTRTIDRVGALMSGGSCAPPLADDAPLRAVG